MKKFVLFSTVVVAAISLSSCRKDKTCSCTTTYTYANNSSVSTTEETVSRDTKRQAKKEMNCYSYKGTLTQDGTAVQVTADCKLK